MGQTLGEPIIQKETTSCENSIFKVGSSAMQGWRINMEDASTQLLSLPDDNNAAFFAEGRIADAIKEGFLELDDQMKSDEETKEEISGTTATIVLIKESKLYCGNAGDSRAVACVSGVAVPLSNDHKPNNEEEAQRIIAAGGWVEFNRVNGNLALSRALGDFGFKKNEEKSPKEQIVTAYPDVETFDITHDYEFIILACDGIWDVMSNQEVIDFCRERLLANKSPEIICEELLDRLILICLMQNNTDEEYLQRLTQRPISKTSSDDAIQNYISYAVRTSDLKIEHPNRKIEQETIEQEINEEIFSTPSHSPTMSPPNPDGDDGKHFEVEIQTTKNTDLPIPANLSQ